MDGVYQLIILGLIIIFFYLDYRKNKKIKFYEENLKKVKEEVAVALEQKTKHFEQEKKQMFYKDDVITTFKQIKESHEKEKEKIEREKEKYESRVIELEKQLNELSKYSRNSGEIITHNLLEDFKRKMVRKNKIAPSDFLIVPNVFIPTKSNNGNLHSRQIDHVLLTKKGIFVIETKYWRGNVLYGLNKQKAKHFSFILNALYPEISETEEKTIVFKDPSKSLEDDNLKEIKVVSYDDDPAKQVRTTAWTLNKFLRNHGINVFCTPILFFNHPEKEFQNFSNQERPYVFDNNESLLNFLETQIDEGNKDILEDVEKVRRLINKANYL